MDINFRGKRALVTGAGKGIGRDIAKQLVKCGAEVVALSRTQEDLDTLKKEVPEIICVQADVSKWDDVQRTLEKLLPIDLLVNNAGVTSLNSFVDFEEKELDKVFSVNFKGVFCVSQIIAKNMIERNEGGAIVNISSVASNLALDLHAAYCSSKGALDSLTKVMALELGPHKIRVNSVNPTVTMTTMGKFAWSDPKKSEPVLSRIPLRRFAEIEDVVNTTLFLLSDKASMLNGVFLPVDGGLQVS